MAGRAVVLLAAYLILSSQIRPGLTPHAFGHSAAGWLPYVLMAVLKTMIKLLVLTGCARGESTLQLGEHEQVRHWSCCAHASTQHSARDKGLGVEGQDPKT